MTTPFCMGFYSLTPLVLVDNPVHTSKIPRGIQKAPSPASRGKGRGEGMRKGKGRYAALGALRALGAG